MAKPTLYTREMTERYTTRGNWGRLSLSDYWDGNAEKYPQKEAVVDSRTRLTWSQAKLWIDRLALGFLEMGLKKDDAVVVQLPNCVELPCLRVALERAGLLCLPAQRVLRHSEMETILGNTAARAIIIPWRFRDFDYYEMIKELKPSLPSLEFVIIWGEDTPPDGKSLKSMLENPLEGKYPRNFLENKKMPVTEFSLIGITTGTTGKPKFVETPLCALLSSGGEIDYLKLTGDDTIAAMTNAPLGPNAISYYNAPQVAARVVLLEHWSVEEGLKLIEKERVTIAGVVPTQLVEMNAYPDLKKYDLSSLRIIWCTGSMLPHHLAIELEDKLNCKIINLYGAMDFGAMSSSPVDAPRHVRLISVGRPLFGNEAKIIDNSGKELSRGEIGKIAFRGAKGFSGYYKDPELTAQNWTKDGWYITGDLGKIDADGYLFIVGRDKDMIIRGGQNIFPVEIENFLLTHPKIADAAVVGIPDPKMGERTCACIVPKPGQSFSFDEMTAFLKEKKIAPYKLPERLLVFDALPYVSGLKLDRKKLRVIAGEKLRI